MDHCKTNLILLLCIHCCIYVVFIVSLIHLLLLVVFKILRSLGYEDPKHYKVCCALDHSQLLYNNVSNCPKCGSSYNDWIDYYVLGLNFYLWLVFPKKGSQLLSHLEDRGD